MCSRSCELGVQPAAGVVEIDMSAPVKTRELAPAQVVKYPRVGVSGIPEEDAPGVGAVRGIHRAHVDDR